MISGSLSPEPNFFHTTLSCPSTGGEGKRWTHTGTRGEIAGQTAGQGRRCLMFPKGQGQAQQKRLWRRLLRTSMGLSVSSLLKPQILIVDFFSCFSAFRPVPAGFSFCNCRSNKCSFVEVSRVNARSSY